jgi:rod shape-determining protein MreC
MNQQPPPFFKRGPAPVALLVFYVALSLALLILDARFRYLENLRLTIATATQPLQAAVHAPVRVLLSVGEHFSSVATLQEENRRLRRTALDAAPSQLRTQQLEEENAHLRKLLQIRERQPADTLAARVIHAARDPFSKRIVIDQGSQHGVVAGQPAIDEMGIIGQVTRVFPFVSEITLITDKEQAVPVQIARNGLRSVVFGTGSGQLELRYMPANADVQNGDLLVTSGLDGIYLPGFPVARVTRIERDNSYSFARIVGSPTAGVDHHREVMLLRPADAEPDLPPEIVAPRASDKPTGSRGKQRRAAQGGR